MKTALGKNVLSLVALLAVVAVVLALVAIRYAGEYRQCYEQSVRSHDFSFDACRSETSKIKHEWGAP